MEIKCRGASLPRLNMTSTPSTRRLLDGVQMVDSSRSSKATEATCNSWSRATSGHVSRLNCGYGDSGRPPKIPGGAPLVFQMEILNINGHRRSSDDGVAIPRRRRAAPQREDSYVDKQAAKSKADRAKELKRLQNMKTSGNTKPELAAWVNKRKKILAKMGCE